METGLSKTLSYFLRHAPGEGNLDMDNQGFVSLESLLELLCTEKGYELGREALVEKLDDPEVERFERRGEAVRATYGHSVDVELDYPEITPDFPLFHGTSPGAWRSIQEQGLRPMNRQYVHLSRTKEEARRVGKRHAKNPVLLSVQPRESYELSFLRAGPVILVEQVPPAMLDPIEQ
jgi:putative RNA 2'-phosphotransferase